MGWINPGLRGGRQKWNLLGQRLHTFLRLLLHCVKCHIKGTIPIYIPSTNEKGECYSLNGCPKNCVLRRWGLSETMNRMNTLLRQVKEHPLNLLLPCETQREVRYLGDGLHRTTLVPWSQLPVSTTMRFEFPLFSNHPACGVGHRNRTSPDRDPCPHAFANTGSFPVLIFYCTRFKKKKNHLIILNVP